MSSDGRRKRRRFPRVKAPMYFREARLRTARIPIVDIGLGGLRVYSDDPFKVGERLSIEFFLPESIRCVVRVAWIKDLENESPAKYDVGLEFLEAPPLLRDHLGKIVDLDA